MIDHAVERWHRSLRRSAYSISIRSSLVIVLLATISLNAQTSSRSNPNNTLASLEEKRAEHKVEFEVASVRPSPPEEQFGGNITLDALDGPAPTSGLIRINAPLALYIIFAYKITDTSQYGPLNKQLPGWAQTGKFHIEARTEGIPTREQLRLMMQSLLKDRFGLAFHFETKDSSVYALVLNKPGRLGPQLKQHPPDAPCLDKPNKPALPSPGEMPPAYCGAMGWSEAGLLHMQMLDVTMDQIANYLSGIGTFSGGTGHLPIVDRTSLSGRFDMSIQFTPSQNLPSPTENGFPESEVLGVTATEALKSQLGLKLVKETAPVNFIVIDHVEAPTPN